MKLRPYQERLVSAVVADLGPRPRDLRSEVVLAACPGAGKTLMSIAAISRLLDAKKVRRVLVLAHATTLLRDNYMSKLREAAPDFDFAEYRPRREIGHRPLETLARETQVVVALPQSLAPLKDLPAFDLVVVDEAHLFYGAPMVDDIIERTDALRVLLLTGTPSPFVARGLPMHLVSMKELYEDGNADPSGPWVSDVRAAVLQSKHDVRRAQYNADGEIKRAVRFRASQTTETLDDLRVWLGGKPWPAVFRKIGKTMIVCRSQAVAAQAAGYFKTAGVPVALSTSEADPKSEQIQCFTSDAGMPLMIVVRRGDIGFDFPGLGALIDMTGTINIDRVFQMFARTVRPNGAHKKLFVKLASVDMFSYTRAILKAALLLAGRAFYETWNGTNLNGVKVPRELAAPCEKPGAQNGGGKPRRLPLLDEGFLVFEDFIEVSTRSDGALIGGTTVGRLVDTLGFRIVDPDAKKAELLAYYGDNRSPVPAGHRLYNMQSKLKDDAEVALAQRSVGWPTQGRLNLIGQRFGKLIVVGAEPQRRRAGPTRWLCRCDCGKQVSADGGNLRRGKPRSCGCLLLEVRATQRRPNKIPGDVVATVLRLVRGGKTQVEAAKIAGVSQSFVSKVVIAKAGVLESVQFQPGC